MTSSITFHKWISNRVGSLCFYLFTVAFLCRGAKKKGFENDKWIHRSNKPGNQLQEWGIHKLEKVLVRSEYCRIPLIGRVRHVLSSKKWAKRETNKKTRIKHVQYLIEQWQYLGLFTFVECCCFLLCSLLLYSCFLKLVFINEQEERLNKQAFFY